jgi:nucleolar MIF4G domain-containing protein 1
MTGWTFFWYLLLTKNIPKNGEPKNCDYSDEDMPLAEDELDSDELSGGSDKGKEFEVELPSEEEDAELDAQSEAESMAETDEPETVAEQAIEHAPAHANEGKYVPPHLKNKLQLASTLVTATPDLQDPANRLRRQIQGLLNRLSDATLPNIASEISDLYLSNTRNSVTEITSANIHDSFVCTYAAFITCLHSSVAEFGAKFLQNLVGKLDYVNSNEETTQESGESKSSLNYSSLIAFLYNFSQVNHRLIYDIIRKLLDSLTEANVEALLRILKISGSKLRSDDPSALKDIIILVNEKNTDSLSYQHV